MRFVISLLAALACSIASSAAQAETATTVPEKIEVQSSQGTSDSSAQAPKQTVQANASEPLKSGLDQPLCVQK